MMNDLSIGADHAKSFEEYCNEHQDVAQIMRKMDFSVQVLLFSCAVNIL
jgi:hypothetical protein